MHEGAKRAIVHVNLEIQAVATRLVSKPARQLPRLHNAEISARASARMRARAWGVFYGELWNRAFGLGSAIGRR